MCGDREMAITPLPLLLTGTTSNDWLKASNVQLCHYGSPEAHGPTYHIIQIKTNHFLITLSHHNVILGSIFLNIQHFCVVESLVTRDYKE